MELVFVDQNSNDESNRMQNTEASSSLFPKLSGLEKIYSEDIKNLCLSFTEKIKNFFGDFKLIKFDIKKADQHITYIHCDCGHVNVYISRIIRFIKRRFTKIAKFLVDFTGNELCWIIYHGNDQKKMKKTKKIKSSKIDDIVDENIYKNAESVCILIGDLAERHSFDRKQITSLNVSEGVEISIRRCELLIDLMELQNNLNDWIARNKHHTNSLNYVEMNGLISQKLIILNFFDSSSNKLGKKRKKKDQDQDLDNVEVKKKKVKMRK